MNAKVETIESMWHRQARMEAGQHAAMTRRGIEWRTPHHLALLRFRALCKGADPVALRRYACDQAEAVLPIFAAEYPKELRPVVAIGTARSYADGGASEYERKAAKALLLALFRDPGQQCRRSRALDAAGAASFCLWKNMAESFEWALYYAAKARGEDDLQSTGAYERASVALEALQRA